MDRDSPDGDGLANIGTPEQFGWLRTIVKFVIVLNFLDAALTLIWVYSGLAVEANPLLAELVHNHPVRFVVVKLGLVSLGTWVLWTNRGRATAVAAIFVAFLAYYGILLYHLQSMRLNLFARIFG